MASGGYLVRFRVQCHGTRPGEHLRVVGEAAELGAWSPKSTSVALTTCAEEFPQWTSAWVLLPEAASGWEYKYVICTNEGPVHWEKGENRRLRPAQVTPDGASSAKVDSATVCEVFGVSEAPRVLFENAWHKKKSSAWLAGAATPKLPQAECRGREPQQSQGDFFVRFVVTCQDTQVGEELRVVGSTGALGNWVPSASTVLLRTAAHDFPVWCSDWVPIPVEDCCFQYKYVISGKGGSARWETREDRNPLRKKASVGTKCRVTITDDFNAKGGGGCTFEEGEQPVAKPWVASAQPLPELPKEEVQESPLEQVARGHVKFSPPEPPAEPRRSSLMRGYKSFGSLTQAHEEFEAEVKAARDMRRRKTIGCLHDVPPGLVPTKRSLGLVADGNDEDLVREAALTDLRRQEDEDTTDEPSDGATGDSESGEENLTTPASSSNSVKVDKLSPSGHDSSPDAEPEATPETTKTFEECYEITTQLGEGAFGVVYRCHRVGSSTECAVKVVNKDRLQPHGLKALLGDEATGREGEISLHSSLPQHDHITCLRDCFEEPSTVRLVMDMCCGGDLFDAICRAKQQNKARSADAALSEPAAARVMSQVLSALAFCHSHGVVHRDIKAENVLLAYSEEEVPLESGRAKVKLCDFGLAARCWASDGNKLRDPVGSPDYVAPEVARREAYGQPVDVWSAGVLLFACLRGRLPFPARTDQEALMLVKEGKCVYDNGWKLLTPEAKDCTQHLLCVNQRERPTAEEALRHAFVRG